jgi:DNA-binding transcriptional regulator YdaS (Cro superfamily)
MVSDENPLERAIRIVGGVSRLAELLHVKGPSIYKWRRFQRIPAERVLCIETATGGQVTRYELRPDLYPPGDKPINGPSAKD